MTPTKCQLSYCYFDRRSIKHMLQCRAASPVLARYQSRYRRLRFSTGFQDFDGCLTPPLALSAWRYNFEHRALTGDFAALLNQAAFQLKLSRQMSVRIKICSALAAVIARHGRDISMMIRKRARRPSIK